MSKNKKLSADDIKDIGRDVLDNGYTSINKLIEPITEAPTARIEDLKETDTAEPIIELIKEEKAEKEAEEEEEEEIEEKWHLKIIIKNFTCRTAIFGI